MSRIEEAVERVMALAQDEATPARMTRAESVEFYETLVEECGDWARIIREEMQP